MGVTGGTGDCLQQPLVKARDPFIYLRNRKRFSCLHSLIQTREGLEEFVTVIRSRGACCYGGSVTREDKALSFLVGNDDNSYTYLVFIPPYYLNYCFAFVSAEYFLFFVMHNIYGLLS